MSSLFNFINNHPWVIPAVLSILFFINVIRLWVEHTRREKAFRALKSMEHNRDLSKVYLKINNGYGDFYDVKLREDGSDWKNALFSGERIPPSILVLPGVYKLQFSVKTRDAVTGYHSKKGPFFAEMTVEPFRDTILVFDNDTLDSWQEDCAVERERESSAAE